MTKTLFSCLNYQKLQQVSEDVASPYDLRESILRQGQRGWQHGVTDGFITDKGEKTISDTDANSPGGPF